MMHAPCFSSFGFYCFPCCVWCTCVVVWWCVRVVSHAEMRGCFVAAAAEKVNTKRLWKDDALMHRPRLLQGKEEVLVLVLVLLLLHVVAWWWWWWWWPRQKCMNGSILDDSCCRRGR